MIDWRSLFDSIKVEWTDRGRNTSRGRVNIQCPWCGFMDSSHHLSIDEDKGLYYCYRDTRHSGNEPVFILQRLLKSRVKAQALLDDYSTNEAAPQKQRRVEPTPYDRFTPAEEMPRLLEYLHKRRFMDPIAVASRFDLRGAETGRWAHRLLIPRRTTALMADATVRAWTGRALYSFKEPRYLNSDVDDHSQWISGNPGGETVVVQEGPMDALKVNSAFHDRLLKVSSVAINGGKLSDSTILMLVDLAPRHILVVPDMGVPLATAHGLAYTLRLACRRSQVTRTKTPEPFKDSGAMNEVEVRQWIEHELAYQRNAS